MYNSVTKYFYDLEGRPVKSQAFENGISLPYYSEYEWDGNNISKRRWFEANSDSNSPELDSELVFLKYDSSDNPFIIGAVYDPVRIEVLSANNPTYREDYEFLRDGTWSVEDYDRAEVKFDDQNRVVKYLHYYSEEIGGEESFDYGHRIEYLK